MAWANWTGEASLGYGGSFDVDGVKVKTDYPNNGSGVTIHARTNRRAVINTMKHELGHWILERHHPYGSEKRRVWSILSPYIWKAMETNAYERERLDWIEVPEITSKTTKTLRDYLNSGDAYKFQPPNGRSGEYFYISNHQDPQLEQGGTYDEATHNDSDKGVMVFNIKEDYSYNDADIRHIASDGYWNWSHIGTVTNPWDTSKDMPLFDRFGADPEGGRTLSDEVKDNNGNWTFIHAIEQTDGDTLKCGFNTGGGCADGWGTYDRRSTYTPNHRPLLASITNPNTTTWDGNSSSF